MKEPIYNALGYVFYDAKYDGKFCMLTHYSKGILNPMRYTGCIYDYTHSFFEGDF